MPETIRAQDIVDRLVKLSSPAEVEKVSRFFRGDGAGNQVLGVSIGKVFPVAKEFKHVPIKNCTGYFVYPQVIIA